MLRYHIRYYKFGSFFLKDFLTLRFVNIKGDGVRR